MSEEESIFQGLKRENRKKRHEQREVGVGARGRGEQPREDGVEEGEAGIKGENLALLS